MQSMQRSSVSPARRWLSTIVLVAFLLSALPGSLLAKEADKAAAQDDVTPILLGEYVQQEAAQDDVWTYAVYLPEDEPDVESRMIVHKAGLTQLELPVQMGARTVGVSSINFAQSIYYALKVTVAVVTTALKDYSLPMQENHDADSYRAKAYRRSLQPYPVIGDVSTDSQA